MHSMMQVTLKAHCRHLRRQHRSRTCRRCRRTRSHTIPDAAPVLGKRLADAQHHALGTGSGNRINAQLETIALRHFEQAGIDAAAYHFFEHRLSARFVHRHRLAHDAIHIHRKTRHALAIEQGKLQLAFENARIRIEECHLQFCECQSPAHLAAYPHRLQLHRLLGAHRNDQARRVPDFRWRRLQLRKRQRSEANAGNKQGGGKGKCAGCKGVHDVLHFFGGIHR